ncbi:MAG: PKD domain-containing protein [Bacteroidetes bacterium]|nr:PKD domain-containing protein [Bacteroidota bacterium]HET6243178.1 PKD domain-containing protein [Bacteroidia bacterium]
MKKLNFICIIFLLLGNSFSIKATHIIGGVVSYECLGNNSYRITIAMYRDCKSGTAAFDNPANVAIYNSANVLIKDIDIPFPGSVQLATTINSPCYSPPSNICVEEAIYTVIVNNLPPIPGGYTITYQRCCRNNTILNLVDPGATGATFTAHIPGTEVITTCNSNPVYKEFPPIFLCNGMSLEFDHSATDIDGDSLVYEICDPFAGATNTDPMPDPPMPPPYYYVNWNPPYNGSYPMSSNPVLSINPQTGVLIGRPNLTGQWVVGICVSEYRNGVLLSRTIRDFQFNVINCPGLIVSAFPSQTLFCNGFDVAFQNNSFNASSFLWDFGVVGVSNDTSVLATPIFTFPTSGTYTVTLIANPYTSCSDTSYSTFDVQPLLAPILLTSDPLCLTGNSFGFNAGGVFGSSAEFSWSFSSGVPSNSNQQNPAGITFPDIGTFPVSLTISENGCSKTVTGSVNVIPDVIAEFPAQAIFCDGFTVSFSNNSFNANSYLWDFGVPGITSDTSSFATPTFTYPSSGIYTITLVANPYTSCADTAYSTYEVYPLLEPLISAPNPSCFTGNYFGFNAGGSFGANANFNWSFPEGNPNASNQQDPTGIVFPDTGLFQVSLTIIENGCSRTVSSTVVVVPDAVADIDQQRVFCGGYTYDFTNLSQNADTYYWTFGDPSNPGAYSTEFEPSYTYPDSGWYTVTLVATGPFCSSTVSQTFSIYPLLKTDFVNPGVLCFKAHDLSFAAGGVFGETASFFWDFGPDANIQSSTNATVPNVFFNSPGIFNVNLIIQENGCTSVKSANVELLLSPVAALELIEKSGCMPLKVEFKEASTSATPLTYLWNFGDGNKSDEKSPEHMFFNPGSYDVSLTVKTETGCIDSSSISIPRLVTVHPFPEANFTILPLEASIFEPKFILTNESKGDSRCIYYFGDGNTSSQCDVEYFYADTGDYQITQIVYSQFECPDTASGIVRVNPEYRFYVPNAFTPDSDGLNDVFKPIIIGEREYEMLIFNRWGEMIFKTTDKEIGWDGRAKNGKLPAQQEVYSYIISLTNVFNRSFVFSGHVTLLR